MIKRIASFVLLAAWIPQAHAFPPCPMDPMEYGPPPEGFTVANAARAGTEAAPWFKADYQFVGDPTVIGQIAPTRAIDLTVDPKTGKCRDRDGLPIPGAHLSAGTLRLDPSYAPRSGFGVIDLPYLPRVATHGLTVEYRLDFTVDNGLLLNPADWLDVVQLDFFRNGSAEVKYPLSVASVYRVRKTQRNDVHATIEIIESRALPPSDGSKAMLVDSVVAVIPLRTGRETGIAMRWTQVAKQRTGDDIARDAYDIDTVLEVLGPSDDVLYATKLPEQWASLVSMGLLDYNVGDASHYEKTSAMELSNMTLSATQQD